MISTKRQPSPSSGDPSSEPPSALPSRLKTKQNVPSSWSPNTTASNRRRLGGLFADLGMPACGSPLKAAPARAESTPIKFGQKSGLMGTLSSPITSFADRLAVLSMVAKGEIDSRESPVKRKGKSKQVEGDKECFADSEDAAYGRKRDIEEGLKFEHLPDDLILEILLRLPPTPQALSPISSVSKRFYNLSRAPILWTRIFNDAGYASQLSREVLERGLGVWEGPKGQWEELTWVPETQGAIDEIKEEVPSEYIPVHYPTLYRTAYTLPQHIRSLLPAHRASFSALSSHTESIYCVQSVGDWLITGSRDRSIKIWRLPLVNSDEEAELVTTVPNAHNGSILGLCFEFDDKERGLLVTSSSDCTASIWALDLSPYTQRKSVAVSKLQTLLHPLAVLDVALTPSSIVTASKDCHVRVYSRDSFELVHLLAGHRGPVNCVTPRKVDWMISREKGEQREEVVSASGDGSWIVWDIKNGCQLRKGADIGRGLACVAWEDDYILTGDNECLVKLYDAETCELLKVFQGHSNLVRAVALRVRDGMAISGSYDESVMIWDLHTGHLIKRPTLEHHSLIFDLEMSCKRLILVGHGHSVQVLTWGKGLPYIDFFV
ncbi:hypothetical protein I312_106522 [Cryptococcus bacillisporus CA1280]|uniref:Beta-transducin repeat containing protein n=1 Tax=Cryptococcus bacillisporus CA1280 TaxID=1296109 RepID=A0A0D0VE29_CRYGA|nr:beta-transducin repeat containing protein [Cryptococcus bacillisporus CA1280]